MTARVATTMDGEDVQADLQTAPNAIGVCQLSWHGQQFARHFNRLHPLDDEARALLAAGSAIVAIDPDAVNEAPSIAEANRLIAPLRIEHLDLLRVYLTMLLAEQQAKLSIHQMPGAKRNRLITVWKRTTHTTQMVKMRLSECRRRSQAQRIGLSPEDMRDPAVLLQRARVALVRVQRDHHVLLETESALLDMISQFFDCYAAGDRPAGGRSP